MCVGWTCEQADVFFRIVLSSPRPTYADKLRAHQRRCTLVVGLRVYEWMEASNALRHEFHVTTENSETCLSWLV